MHLYITGLPKQWTDADLYTLVHVYGHVMYCKMRNGIHDQAIRYGVVRFALPAYAMEAMRRLKGVTVSGYGSTYVISVSDSPPDEKQE